MWIWNDHRYSCTPVSIIISICLFLVTRVGSESTTPGPTPTQECPAGNYCPESIDNPNTCLAGYYCPAGSVDQTQCEAGYFCPTEGLSEQTLCQAGHYCPVVGFIDQTQCPSGSFCPSDGMTTPDPCPAGYYCPDGSTQPTLCVPGYYCPNNSATPFQYPCPIGTFRELPGAASIEECEFCTEGFYCSTFGLTQPEGPCDAGYYCTTGSDTPTPVNSSSGDVCPPGHYCSVGTSNPTPCPEGYYWNGTGAQNVLGCLDCPAGFYCESGAWELVICPQGFFCPANSGTNDMLHCPDWTYGLSAGLSDESQCTSCLGQTRSPMDVIRAARMKGDTTTQLAGVSPAVKYVTPSPIYVDCGRPLDLINGSVYFTCTMYYNLAVYNCNEGFYLTGPSRFHCDRNGNWTLEPDTELDLELASPACLFEDCGPLAELENGQIHINSTTIDSIVRYECRPGYGLHGHDIRVCTVEGTWNGTAPECIPFDCGLPPLIRNGNYTLLGSTTYGSIALYKCIRGYHLTTDNNVRQCSATWTGEVGICVQMVCSDPVAPVNGTVIYDKPVLFNTKAVFTCNLGYAVIGWNSVTCVPPGVWSQAFPTCERVPARVCTQDIDSYGTTWNRTVAGATISLDCPGHLLGNVSRSCTINGVWRLPLYTCIQEDIVEATEKVDAIISSNTTSEIKTSVVEDVLVVLLNSTTSVQSANGSDRAMYDGEITMVTETLEKVAEISVDIIVTEDQSKDFIETASNLLRPKNSGAYQTLQEGQDDENKTPPASGADRLLAVIGSYANTIANSVHISANESERIIVTDNLEMTVSQLTNKDELRFPMFSTESAAKLSIATEFLQGATSYSGVLYYNLSSLMSTGLDKKGQRVNSFVINTPVLALQLFNRSDSNSEPFEIKLDFNHYSTKYFEPTCSFWNYSKALWDTTGCRLMPDRSSDSGTSCTCNHLTNFAVLMNPTKTNLLGETILMSTNNIVFKVRSYDANNTSCQHLCQKDIEPTSFDDINDNINTLALSIITYIGCSISTVCLVITIVIHGLFWRHLKSDRAVLLVNLSAALVVSYIIFLAGVEQTGNGTGCTAIAIMLHYIYLVVFVLMLSEGIEIMVTVVYVFPMKSRLKWLLLMSWGSPMLIVAIAAGVTKSNGYGSDEHCWLSVDDGLIWAFVGPALLIITVNFVQLLLVMKKMFSVKSIKARSKINKAKAGIRCLAVLMPLIGCAWVIGVFYVNEDMAWIQYVFAALNSLQGFVIMLFHCLLNPQVQNTISKRWSQYKSASLAYTRRTNSTYSNTSSNVSDSTDKRNNSVASIGSTTSPDKAYTDIKILAEDIKGCGSDPQARLDLLDIRHAPETLI